MKKQRNLVCRRLAWVFILCLMLSCLGIIGVAAQDGVVVSYNYANLQPADLYSDWYCDNWGNVTAENNQLMAQSVMLFARQTYQNYSMAYDITCLGGSHTSFAKTYIALRQPAGYMLGGDLVAMTQNDMGNDNSQARPGRLGILVGMARTQVEIIIHTITAEGVAQNVSVLIDTPQGKDFRGGVSMEIKDATDTLEVYLDGTMVAKVTMSEAQTYSAEGYTGQIYKNVVVTDDGGQELLKTQDGFVPAQGMFGFVGRGGRFGLATLTISALSGNAQDAVVATPTFDHENIHLEKAPETEASVVTQAPEVVTDPVEDTQGESQETTSQGVEVYIPGFSDKDKTALIIIMVLVNILLVSRGIWCFALMKKQKKQTICLIILAVVLLASDIVMPICMANLPEGSTVIVPADTTEADTEATTEADTEAETEGEDVVVTPPAYTMSYLLDEKGNTPSVHITNANQTAQDALGRVLPTYAEVGDAKGDKYVGVFYTLWTMMAGNVQDNSKNLARNPLSPTYGSVYSYHWWAEPEVGYASSTDAWVARRNMQYLAMAGVDYIYMDFTNGGVYEEAFEVLLDVCLQMRAEGTPVPCIVPWVYGDDSGTYRDIGYLYRRYYSQEKYKELWFYMDGKPLAMLKRVEDNVAQYRTENKYLPALNNKELTDFFTFRFAWVPSESDAGHWPGERVYRWSWGNPLFMHEYKSGTYAYGWDERVRLAEQITIIVGSYCNVDYGRSGTAGTLDQFREKDVSGQGIYLQYQFDWVMEKHPEVEYLNISGWNEWIAQYYPEHGDFGFVDSYNREFSRDMEPMKGGYTDNYFYQLCAIIRKFKGMEAPASQNNQVTMDMSDLSAWDKITQGVYTDYVGDTTWRDGYDPSGSINYVNQTGRNDIIESKVAFDAGYVYFYAGTKDDLTPHTDKNWMLLFIDSDADATTGWEGYDYAVNLAVVDESRTTLCKYQNGVWQEIGLVSYKYQGSKLAIAIPRSLIEETGEQISLNFHWIDNVTDVYALYSWFTTGDSAPERRSRYVFDATCAYDASKESILDGRTQGQIKYMPSVVVPANVQKGLQVSKFWITENYGKQPEIDLLDGAGGNRIYTGVVEDVGIIENSPRTAYALAFDGYVNITTSGEVTFTLTADDGAMLYIDGRLVIDLSGVHTTKTETGSILLQAGYHEIRVEYFENGNGNSTLSLTCDKADGYVTKP